MFRKVTAALYPTKNGSFRAGPALTSPKGASLQSHRANAMVNTAVASRMAKTTKPSNKNLERKLKSKGRRQES